MKIKFFTNINHEFKTPLALILASIEKLKKNSVAQHTHEQIDSIQHNAKKLLTLITQILNVSNVKNESQLIASKADLVDFVRQITASFKDLAGNKGITIQFESELEQFYTAFDTDKLDKIVFNLLSNAVKFTPKGGRVAIHLERLEPNKNQTLNGIQIRVTDTGIGITKEEQAQIYDRFFKGSNEEQNNVTGSGVGLSLVKEYVELFQGEILVSSTLGKGTQFTVDLPLQEINLDENARAQAEADKSLNSTSEGIVPGVVIIEDDPDFLNFLTKSFKDHFSVFVAGDGEAGWKKILSVRPDLILCDYDIPFLNGIELCNKLRKDSRTEHIPFVMITGNDLQEAKLKALKTGVSDYITKPFNLEVLQARVSNLIDQGNLFKSSYSKKIEITDKSTKVAIESEDEKLMRQVIQIVRKNAGNPNFSVKALAKEVGVSRSYLYNKTLVLFEKPPLQLITDVRLELGKELLEKSTLTISEIAFQSGFNNPKYFTRNFKKKYKKLPSKYRNDFLQA